MWLKVFIQKTPKLGLSLKVTAKSLARLRILSPVTRGIDEKDLRKNVGLPISVQEETGRGCKKRKLMMMMKCIKCNEKLDFFCKICVFITVVARLP